MSTVPEQNEPHRLRWRFVLPWFVGVSVLAFLATSVALTQFADGSPSAAPTSVGAGGSGTAPVYDSPPVDTDPTPSTGSSASTTTAPGEAESREVRERTSVGGGALAPTPRASGAAVLGPPRAHGVSLLLTSALSEPLRPGFERALYITVRNPNTFPVDLYRVDIRVDDAPVAGCLGEWVRTGHYRYTTGTPRRIAPSSTVVVNLPIELENLTDVDQNLCQNTYFPLRLSGVAVDPS